MLDLNTVTVGLLLVATHPLAENEAFAWAAVESVEGFAGPVWRVALVNKNGNIDVHHEATTYGLNIDETVAEFKRAVNFTDGVSILRHEYVTEECIENGAVSQDVHAALFQEFMEQMLGGVLISDGGWEDENDTPLY